MKLNYTSSLIYKDKLIDMIPSIQKSYELLKDKTGLGNDLLGWMDLPSNYDKDEFRRIKEVAGKIQKNSNALIVIGIGGSYLGARACIEALTNSFHNLQQKTHRKVPEIYYAGNNVSGNYLMDLIDLVKDKDISINVISKSGTTMEPAITFRIFKKILEDKYGVEGAKDGIFITTDKFKGGLKELAESKGYEMFDIPDNIGGRYSVFTPVGLLPMAIMGIDIDKVMDGACSAMVEYDNPKFDKNISYQYAAIRNILYEEGKDIEILANYEPRLHYLAEWWRQLFGESEGKGGKGIYPSSANYTTDLHSFGQLVQDGKRNIFQTIIHIETPKNDMILQSNEDDFDKLNYLSGKTIDSINKSAFKGALKAHTSGGVPNIVITLPELNEFYMGKLMYFFQKSCAISGYILGINPFDQPAVEEYKINMYENLREKDI